MNRKLRLSLSVLFATAGFALAEQTPASSDPRDLEIQALKQQVMLLMERVNALEKNTAQVMAALPQNVLSGTNGVALAVVSTNGQRVAQGASTNGTSTVAALEKRIDALSERLKWYGDIRLRYDYIDLDGKDENSRLRLRARFGLDAKVTEGWTAGLLVSTEPNNPASGNTDLGSDFIGKDIGLDRIYVRYQPWSDEKLYFTGGKIAQPWIAVNDLVYDHDVNPEGVAFSYEKKVGDFELLSNGGFLQDHTSFNDARSPLNIFAGQLAARAHLEDYTFLAGVTDYLYDGDTTKTYDGKPLNGADDINDVELFTEASTTFFDIPFALHGQYLVNTMEDEENKAWLLGARIGKADPGKLEFRTDYRYLERNSAFLRFTDSDCWSGYDSGNGGGSSGKGYRLQLRYGLNKYVTPALTYYLQTRDLENPHDYNRVQADIAVKF